MLPIVRRAPWIAIGAAAAYYLDGQSGPARRRVLAGRARGWTRHLRGAWLDHRYRPPTPGDPEVPLVPSVPEERVRSRAEAPLAEEQAAGVPDPAPEAMAEQIFAESEQRVTDRAGTGTERRRSEDTVETTETV